MEKHLKTCNAASKPTMVPDKLLSYQYELITQQCTCAGYFAAFIYSIVLYSIVSHFVRCFYCNIVLQLQWFCEQRDLWLSPLPHLCHPQDASPPCIMHGDGQPSTLAFGAKSLVCNVASSVKELCGGCMGIVFIPTSFLQTFQHEVLLSRIWNKLGFRC